jgi:ribosome maturation factor RimP
MSDALDADTADGPDFADPYVLEVSSPGVDRPLTEERHWRRAVGRLVDVSVDGAALTGRVLDTDGHGVRLEVAGVKGRPAKTKEIAWSALGRGKVQVEFNRKSGADDSVDSDGADLDDDTDSDDEYPDEFADELVEHEED